VRIPKLLPQGTPGKLFFSPESSKTALDSIAGNIFYVNNLAFLRCVKASSDRTFLSFLSYKGYSMNYISIPIKLETVSSSVSLG